MRTTLFVFLFSAALTVANPIKSKGEYTLTINIRDKKGDANI